MLKLSFKDRAARVTRFEVERVRDEDGTVIYHRFVAAYGLDVRVPDMEVEIDFTIGLYGREVSAFNNIRITPREYKQCLYDICKSHGVNAKNLGLFDAKYVPVEPAPLLQQTPVEAIDYAEADAEVLPY